MSIDADVMVNKTKERILNVTDVEVEAYKKNVTASALKYGISSQIDKLEDDDIKVIIAVQETLFSQLRENHEDNPKKTSLHG